MPTIYRRRDGNAIFCVFEYDHAPEQGAPTATYGVVAPSPAAAIAAVAPESADEGAKPLETDEVSAIWRNDMYTAQALPWFVHEVDAGMIAYYERCEPLEPIRFEPWGMVA